MYISDLHLSPGTPERNAFFQNFITQHCQDLRSLTIIGDFFNAYAGYKQLGYPFYRELCEMLAALVARGVDLHFVAGNRDFLFARDAKRFGITGHADFYEKSDGPLRIIAHHGDAFCLDDRAYLRYRAVMRKLPLHMMNHLTPAWFGQWVVGGMRRRSMARKKRSSEYEQMRWDIQDRATIPFIRSHGCDILICGHIHRPQTRVYDLGERQARMLVLGEWDDQQAIVALGKDSDVKLYALGPKGLILWPHEPSLRTGAMPAP